MIIGTKEFLIGEKVKLKFYNMLPEDKKEILESYRWIKVKKYIDDENLTWEERYKNLMEHHLKETEFLINKIRSIVKDL